MPQAMNIYQWGVDPMIVFSVQTSLIKIELRALWNIPSDDWKLCSWSDNCGFFLVFPE
jgi:hypothetical protein